MAGLRARTLCLQVQHIGAQGGVAAGGGSHPARRRACARVPFTSEGKIQQKNTGSFPPASVRILLNAVSRARADGHKMQLFFISLWHGEQARIPPAGSAAPGPGGTPPAPRSAGRGAGARSCRSSARKGPPVGTFDSRWRLGLESAARTLAVNTCRCSERGQSQEPSPVGRVLRPARHCPLHHGASQTPPETSLSPRCITCAGLSPGGVGRGRVAKSVIAQVSASISLGSNSVTMKRATCSPTSDLFLGLCSLGSLGGAESSTRVPGNRCLRKEAALQRLKVVPARVLRAP